MGYILKNYCHIWNQHTWICWICQNAKFLRKKTFVNLGPRIPYLGIFRLKFQKNIIIIGFGILEFFEIQKFVQAKKFTFRTKNTLCEVYLSYTIFLGCNFKHSCDILNHYPQIIHTGKFCELKRAAGQCNNGLIQEDHESLCADQYSLVYNKYLFCFCRFPYQ